MNITNIRRRRDALQQQLQLLEMQELEIQRRRIAKKQGTIILEEDNLQKVSSPIAEEKSLATGTVTLSKRFKLC